MKKLKILSAILVLVGVAMVGVGGISKSNEDAFVSPKSSLIHGVTKMVHSKKEHSGKIPRVVIKPATSEFTNFRVESMVPDDPYHTPGEPINIHITGIYTGNMVDDAYFYFSFYRQDGNNNRVACYNDPDADYECYNLNNGTPVLRKYLGHFERNQTFDFYVKITLLDTADYMVEQYPYAFAFGNATLSDYYSQLNAYAYGLKVYRIYGHYNINNLKVSMLPNKDKVYIDEDQSLVYTLKIQNMDTTYTAKNVQLKLAPPENYLDVYAMVRWPNESVDPDEYMGTNKTIYLGDIAPGEERLFFVYTKIRNVQVGDVIHGLIDEANLLKLDNARDPAYVESFGTITVQTVDVPVLHYTGSPRLGGDNYINNSGASGTKSAIKKVISK